MKQTQARNFRLSGAGRDKQISAQAGSVADSNTHVQSGFESQERTTNTHDQLHACSRVVRDKRSAVSADVYIDLLKAGDLLVLFEAP